MLLVLINTCGCSEGEAISASPLGDINLKLETDNLSVQGVNDLVEIEIEIDNPNICKFIAVRKLKNNNPLYRLPDIKDVNTGKCLFTYTIAEEDLVGGSLSFQFIPVDKNDYYGNEYILNINIKDQKQVIKVVKATKIARITGNTVAGETIPNPNNTAERFNVGGTDLGIYWRMGNNKVGILFGDTYGKEWRPGFIPDWRSNILAFSTDTDLDDGLTFDSMVCSENGDAKQIIYSAHDTSGNGDYSSIPTAAIRINGIDYVHYMNVKCWNPAWITNWSGYAVSKDNGNTWELYKNIYSATSRFAQQALWEKDDYVYCIGSIIGRRGLPYLARFKPENILDPQKYEYWNSNNGWLEGDENGSTPLFGNYQDEMYAEPTLIYHDYFKKWITVYYNEIKNQIVMRSADEINGEWSNESIIAEGSEYTMPYGGFIYPLNLNEPHIYISLSQWDPLYNVFLMKVELKLDKE